MSLEVWSVNVPKDVHGLDVPKDKRGKTTFYCKVNYQGVTLEDDTIDGLFDQIKKLTIPAMGITSVKV